MKGGGEVLARIPNPKSGHPELVISSEVVTLDFIAALDASYPHFDLLTNEVLSL